MTMELPSPGVTSPSEDHRYNGYQNIQVEAPRVERYDQEGTQMRCDQGGTQVHENEGDQEEQGNTVRQEGKPDLNEEDTVDLRRSSRASKGQTSKYNDFVR